MTLEGRKASSKVGVGSSVPPIPTHLRCCLSKCPQRLIDIHLLWNVGAPLNFKEDVSRIRGFRGPGYAVKLGFWLEFGLKGLEEMKETQKRSDSSQHEV